MLQARLLGIARHRVFEQGILIEALRIERGRHGRRALRPAASIRPRAGSKRVRLTHAVEAALELAEKDRDRNGADERSRTADMATRQRKMRPATPNPARAVFRVAISFAISGLSCSASRGFNAVACEEARKDVANGIRPEQVIQSVGACPCSCQCRRSVCLRGGTGNGAGKLALRALSAGRFRARGSYREHPEFTWRNWYDASL